MTHFSLPLKMGEGFEVSELEIRFEFASFRPPSAFLKKAPSGLPGSPRKSRWKKTNGPDRTAVRSA
jgi:hypothetical protein